MSERARLDRLLVERGLCESRSRAQALVLAGRVIVGEHAVTKPGTLVPREAPLRLKEAEHEYASRGGIKLRGALDAFAALDVRGRRALDVGASTGGFTDCLLRAGVERVWAVDVGYGQLAWRIASDPRVVVLDRQNIRELRPEAIGTAVDLAVVDCSFISAGLVLSCLPPLLDARADVVVLVKPQFELGPDRVGKGGIVRDPVARDEAVATVARRAEELGLRVAGRVASPIAGKGGNLETFLWLTR